MRNLEIKSLSDERLMPIDPAISGFYDRVLQYRTNDPDINHFINIVRRTKKERLTKFWRPVMDPSEKDGKIIYAKGRKPAVGHLYEWWEDMSKKMPSVEGRIWTPSTIFHYHADRVDIINRLTERGYDLSDAIENIVFNSSEFGDYQTKDFKTTGSHEICGRYDLGNTVKIMKPSQYIIENFPDCRLYANGCSCDTGFYGSFIHPKEEDDCICFLVLE